MGVEVHTYKTIPSKFIYTFKNPPPYQIFTIFCYIKRKISSFIFESEKRFAFFLGDVYARLVEEDSYPIVHHTLFVCMCY
jgi:hypothetical protein